MTPGLYESLGFLMGKSCQFVDKTIEPVFEQAGITARQYGVLLVAHEYPGSTQKETGELQRIDRTSVGQLIDSLEKKELLERRSYPGDRRAYGIYLTQKGQDAMNSIWSKVKAREDVALRMLDEQEQKALYGLLKKIVHGGKE